MNQTHTLSLNDGSSIQCNVVSANYRNRELCLNVLRNKHFDHFAKQLNSFQIFNNQLQITVSESDREVLLSGLFVSKGGQQLNINNRYSSNAN